MNFRKIIKEELQLRTSFLGFMLYSVGVMGAMSVSMVIFSLWLKGIGVLK